MSFEPSGAQELLAEFESLVGEVIRLRTQGCTGTEIARAQGAADGFARALVTSGIASERDLLLVAQRSRRGGTRSVEATESAAELLRRPSQIAV